MMQNTLMHIMYTQRNSRLSPDCFFLLFTRQASVKPVSIHSNNVSLKLTTHLNYFHSFSSL